MGQVKNWLMEMEDDASNMMRIDFEKKHGERMTAQIWDKMHAKDNRWDYACSSVEEREQALAEVAMEMEIAAKEGR